MTNSIGAAFPKEDILASDTSYLCMRTNDLDVEGLSNQYNMNDNISVSVGEMKEDIIVETKSALTELSFPIGNQIPTLLPIINVTNEPNSEDVGESPPHSNVQNVRLYLQKLCYERCKWTSSLIFLKDLETKKHT